MLNKPFMRQVLQFSMVGGFNGLLDLGALNIFLFVWPTENVQLLLLYNTTAYLLAVINSYIWNSRIAFRHTSNKNLHEKVLFVIQAGISLIISNIVFIVAIDLFNYVHIPELLNQNISKAISMFLSSSASFFFMKYFVFRRIRKLQ